MTTVEPTTSGNIEKTHWAEWYAGPQSRATLPVGRPSTPQKLWATRSNRAGSDPVVDRADRTPFGKPVVPDV